MDLKAQLGQQCKTWGVDLYGIAAANSLSSAPEGFRPLDLMPKAKSVVVLAKQIPKETVINQRRLSTYARSCTTSMAMLDTAALQAACWLELQGGRALAIAADDPYTAWDEAMQHGMGDLSHRHAAVAAGLGRLGKNSLLVTPQYGNRVHLVSVLTDLVLEPDQPIPGDPCPPDCHLCTEVCPAGAINDNRTVTQNLCRPQINHTLPRGYSVYGCWECRRVCPLGR